MPDIKTYTLSNRDTYGDLGKIFLDHFQKHGEPSIPFLVNGRISSETFLKLYKRLPPIEQMPEKEKIEMKKYVIELFPEKSVEEKLICCKIVYTIGSLI